MKISKSFIKKYWFLLVPLPSPLTDTIFIERWRESEVNCLTGSFGPGISAKLEEMSPVITEKIMQC